MFNIAWSFLTSYSKLKIIAHIKYYCAWILPWPFGLCLHEETCGEKGLPFGKIPMIPQLLACCISTSFSDHISFSNLTQVVAFICLFIKYTRQDGTLYQPVKTIRIFLHRKSETRWSEHVFYSKEWTIQQSLLCSCWILNLLWTRGWDSDGFLFLGCS